MSRSATELLRQIKGEIDEIDPSDARAQASNGAVLVDIREPEEWAAIERALDGRPDVVRLSMEPARDRHARMQLAVHDPAAAPETRLAVCDDHGLPIRWEG